jgi:ApeA N-terminal domain 1
MWPRRLGRADPTVFTREGRRRCGNLGRMLEERTLEGEWWVPDNPARKVRATLSFTAEGFWLRTKNSALLAPPTFEPDQVVHDLMWEQTTVPVLWGTTDDDRTDVTLFDVGGLRMMLPGDLRGTETWRPDVALVGAHLDATVAFDEVSVRTEHLDEWAGTSPMARQFTLDADGRPMALEVKAERKVIDTADLDEFGRVEIESQPEGEVSGHEATVVLRTRFRLHPTMSMPWREAFDKAGVLRDLVRLAAGAPCAFDEIQLRVCERDEHGRPVWVDMLRRTTALLRGRGKSVHSFDLLFGREAMPGGFETGLRRWRELRERYRRAWGLMTASDDARVGDAGDQIVAYGRAIEVFHAVDFGGSPAALTERDERVDRAINALPEDLKDWARPLLEESTPPVARHRLMEIIGQLGTVGNRLAGNDPELFASYAVNTRNDLVHPTGVSAKRVLTEIDDIFWFGRTLSWIATAYLLRKVGMSESDVDEVVGRSGQADAAADHVAAFLRAH